MLSHFLRRHPIEVKNNPDLKMIARRKVQEWVEESEESDYEEDDDSSEKVLVGHLSSLANH